MSTTTIVPTAKALWNIDPAHSSAEFKVKYMMISSVKGSFSHLTGTLTEYPTDLGLSRVEASIDIATIRTGDEQRDGHLKSAEFLDCEQYPKMTFVSTSVEKKGKDELSVMGDLTIHGVTNSVIFSVEGPSAPAKDPWGNTRIGLSATTRINRKEFGLVWNTALETGGVLVGEEIQISLDVQFIQV